MQLDLWSRLCLISFAQHNVLRFIHVVVGICSWFFSTDEFHFMNIPKIFFFHSSVDGHLDFSLVFSFGKKLL